MTFTNHRQTNQLWFEFIKKTSFVNLGNFFAMPHELILQEVKKKDVQVLASPARQQATSQARDYGINEPIGGIKTPFVSPQGWAKIPLFNAKGSLDEINVYGVNQLLGSDYHRAVRSFRRHSWTPAVELLPSLRSWVDEKIKPYVYLGFIHLMILESKGMIAPHRDVPTEFAEESDPRGTYGVLNSFNFAINQPLGAKFVLAGQELNYKAGECIWLSLAKEHWLVNFSQETRFHLNFQVIWKPNFRQHIVSHLDQYQHYPRFSR